MKLATASYPFHGAPPEAAVNVSTDLEVCRHRDHPDTADPRSGRLGGTSARASSPGAKNARIDTGGRHRHGSDAQLDRIGRTCRGRAKRVHDQEYVIGPETHGNATHCPDNLLGLHASVDSPSPACRI